MGIINTANCSKECIYAEVDDKDLARVKVICHARDGKSFYWGQRIPCELKEKKGHNIYEESSNI